MTRAITAVTSAMLLSLLLTLCPLSAVLADSEWGSPQVIDEHTDSATGPQVAIDGSNVVAVWSQSNDCVSNYSTDGGATWEGTQTISAGTSSYCDAPQVAMSGSNVIAVWYEVVGSARISANFSGDGGVTWGTPSVISDSAAIGTSPHVAISGNVVVATWGANDATDWLIYCNRSEDGGATWEGAELIASGAGTTGSTSDDYPRVAADGEHAVVVWVTNERQDPWRKDVHSVPSADGGETWGTSLVISTGTEAYPPKVAMTGSNVVVIWNDNSGNTTVCTNRSTDGGATWEGVETIDNGALGGKYGPHLAMSGSNVVAVWYQYFMGVATIWSNRSNDAGASWDTSRAVDTTNPWNAFDPQVALVGANAVTAWYYESDGTAQRIYGSYSSDGGLNWGSAELIQDDVAVSGSWPRLAASGRHAVVVWHQHDAVIGVYSNHLLMLESPPQYLGSWWTRGSGDGQFELPQGVSVAPDGSVYVTDTNNHRVQRFTSTGSYDMQWGSYGTGDGELNQPVHLTAEAGDTIYVCDGDNDRVQYFDSDGTYLGQFGTTGDTSDDGPGEFVWTMGIAIDSFFDVYVTDWGNHRVQKFDSSGVFDELWGNGLFTSPFGLATDSDDNVYLAEWGGNRIQKFDGSSWSVFVADAGLNHPTGIAVDDDGRVYVCDTDNDRIQVFDRGGNLVTRWGSNGTAYGQFRSPNGIAIHPNGDIYVADTENHRIQVFSYRELSSMDIPLATGWNMVSVPMAMFPSNSTPGTVFPGSVAVYTWNPVTKSYEVPATIVPEHGYWVAAPGATTITVSGAPVGIWDSQLTAGWNMVGSVCGDPVPVGGLVDEPSGSILDSAVYWWDPVSKSYSTCTHLQRGKGYWVATTVDCELTMSAPPS